jgi:uncharacterized protein (UPF0264 family)
VSAGLLVSVRSAEEAEAALRGGAEIIDVKEPANGPLGRARDAIIREVLAAVAGRRPVSAALGELAEDSRPPQIAGLSFLKWGLAGWEGRGWRPLLAARMQQQAKWGGRVVSVAYADWSVAGAPPVNQVCRFALQQPGGVLLLDTFFKEAGSTLHHWLGVDEISAICRRARQAGVRIALAGSLGPREIELLRDAEPDWFAVRGAACDEGRREGPVRAAKVRELVELIREFLK